MARWYVPWHDRPKHFEGPAKIAADMAVAVYRVSKPLVERFALGILLGALFGSGVAVFAVTELFAGVADVRAHLVANGDIGPADRMSLEDIRFATQSLESPLPAALIWPFQFSLVRDLIAIHGVIIFATILVMGSIWAERKVSAHIQSRLGPMRVGGWHGWAQSLADPIKLIGKEDLIPREADRPLFRLAVYLTVVPALAGFLALPFGVFWVFRDLDVALIFILAMMGIQVMGVLIAGWASNNKWSVYGAMREALQMVSYEIPMGMALLIPVMVAGTLRLNEIAAAQSGGWFNWYAWHSPLTFVAMFIYFVASLASCKRAPFDLPEAESELVAGFHTEYSGIRWSLFFFAEYVAMFIVSGLLVILFLGAWDAPWALPAAAPGDPFYPWAHSDSLAARFAYGLLVSGPVWFILKCAFFIFVQMWLRWTLPRLRIDQVLYSCVQVMLPLTMVVLLGCAFWELLATDAHPWFSAMAGVITVVLGLIGAIATIAILVVAFAGVRRASVLVGTQAVARPLPSS